MRLIGVRTGELSVDEIRAAVAAVSSPHRAEAFDACRALIDELKATVQRDMVHSSDHASDPGRLDLLHQYRLM